MKFKKGDKVVLVKHEVAATEHPLGSVGVVRDVDISNMGFPIKVNFGKRRSEQFKESELILLTETTRILYGQKTK